MSIELYLIALLLALAALYFVVPFVARTFVRYRGKRVITCPETRKPAAIEVDAGHAALSSGLYEMLTGRRFTSKERKG